METSSFVYILQWYVLILTLRLAVCTLFGKKQDQIWSKIFCIPKNMHSRTHMMET